MPRLPLLFLSLSLSPSLPRCFRERSHPPPPSPLLSLQEARRDAIYNEGSARACTCVHLGLPNLIRHSSWMLKLPRTRATNTAQTLFPITHHSTQFHRFDSLRLLERFLSLFPSFLFCITSYWSTRITKSRQVERDSNFPPKLFNGSPWIKIMVLDAVVCSPRMRHRGF